MNPSDLTQANFILNAIQVGGLIGFMTVSLLAFMRGWVYAAAIVDELKTQIRELTSALKAANDGMERMADAWEERNRQEAERAREALLLQVQRNRDGE